MSRRKLIDLLLRSLVARKWHWHRDLMRRRMPDGSVVTREPTPAELAQRDDFEDRKAW